MPLSFAQALRVNASTCIALIGAGGKTTAMFQLARQLPSPVIVSATSHLGTWQLDLADQHIIAETSEAIDHLDQDLPGLTLITGAIDGDRTQPLDESLLFALHRFCQSHGMPLLVEADGSRGRPLKAWAEHEPPIPSFAESVLQVVGLSGLGQRLTNESVHRPEIFSKLSQVEPGDSIDAPALIKVLLHPEGGLKNIRGSARKILLLNQADTPDLQSAAHGMAQGLMQTYDSVIIASLQQERIFAVHEPIAGIVLAAGESSRYGQPKQLLEWKGQPFVRAVARTAREAGLRPVIVVTGAYAPQVEEAVKDLDVQARHNSAWKEGQASSIKTGIDGAAETGGAIFLLADQPQITTSILRALVERHAEGLAPVVAPMIMDRRANPVLFDRATFPDLMRLDGDVGGRALFHKYRVEYLPWHDERLLLDVDTPDMYRRLISDETL